MSYINLRCKNCGSNIKVDTEAHSTTCKYCDSTFMIIDLIDSKNTIGAKNQSDDEIKKKLSFDTAIKQGEMCLVKSDFTTAEEFFKRAIEINDASHKGYLGVAKAKTQNFTVLPESNDYKEYAKIAIIKATDSEFVEVKAEIAKLDILENEKRKAHKIKKQEEQKEKEDLLRKQDNEKFFGKIVGALVAVVTALLLAIIFLSSMPKDYDDADALAQNTQIETIDNQFLLEE